MKLPAPESYLSVQSIETFWCRGRDSNPHALADNGFSYHYGFRRLIFPVCGLDYTFAFYYAFGATVRREPSSLYTFLEAA
jgi:hypothetical protein